MFLVFTRKILLLSLTVRHKISVFYQEQISERDPAAEQGGHREAGDARGLRGGVGAKLVDRSTERRRASREVDQAVRILLKRKFTLKRSIMWRHGVS